MNDTWPECIGYYSKPLGANKCENCRHSELCKKVIARERLKPLHAKIVEIRKVLRGER
jgi:hypothetical protein